MKKYLFVALLLLQSYAIYCQENDEVKLIKINKSGYLDYGVVEFNNDTYIRNGYVFIVKSDGRKVAKIVIDSVSIDRAYGFIDFNPAITDKENIIKNHELSLYRSYYVGFQYAYELSLSDNKDKFHHISLGMDFYPSFVKYRKNTNLWIGADVGFLFGELYDSKNEVLHSDFRHAFVRFELGVSPFYHTKTHRGLVFGASMRPHKVKFLIPDYYGVSEDQSTDAYFYISNVVNVFLGYQVSFLELRAEMSVNSMDVDKNFQENMHSIYLRAAFIF